jgi:hypothetical protein
MTRRVPNRASSCTLHGWAAPEQVLAMLRKIGQKRHGQDAIVTYMPSLYE